MRLPKTRGIFAQGRHILLGEGCVFTEHEVVHYYDNQIYNTLALATTSVGGFA